MHGRAIHASDARPADSFALDTRAKQEAFARALHRSQRLTDPAPSGTR